MVMIDDFVLPPRGNSKLEEFDLLAHLEIEAPNEDEEDVEVEDPNAQ